MNARAEAGQYKSLQALRSDYELMCFNALQFNREGDFYWKQAENMYKKGKAIFNEFATGTTTSPYGLEAEQVIAAYARALRKKERNAASAASSWTSAADRKARGSAKHDAEEEQEVSNGLELAPCPDPLSFVAAAIVPLAGEEALYHSFTVRG